MTDTITATPVSFRLVGPLLLQHEAMLAKKGVSRKQIILQCGYKNPTTGKPAYYKFYSEKLKALDYQERQDIQLEAYHKNRYPLMMRSIYSRKNYERNGYSILHYPDLTIINRGRQTLLTIDHTKKQVTIFECEHSRQNKDRINYILNRLCGMKLFQRGIDWKVVSPRRPDVAYETGASFDMI